MQEKFLKKYYSIGKTTSVKKDICEFTQGRVKPFMKLRRDLETSLVRALTMECQTMNFHKYLMMG